MKAIVLRRAGSADRLMLSEVADPVPEPDEALVRIHATSVTRGDVVLRKMPRLVTRLVGETPKSIPGHEFAGEVASVGGAVTKFGVGDRVFGSTTGLAHGSHAEYICVPEDGILAHIPQQVAYQEAAPIPVGAMAALHFLREGGIGDGRRVLINGASGSVGSFAVQIAKHFGAQVSGTCSPSNVELVRSLGADEVIDYTKQDFTEANQAYDVVFDAAGKTSVKKSRGVLADGGTFVTTQARRRENIEDLLAVRDMVAAGSVRAVIARRYSLDQVPEAHRYVESGHKRGNVVVVLVEESRP